jgi:hypothetical protein
MSGQVEDLPAAKIGAMLAAEFARYLERERHHKGRRVDGRRRHPLLPRLGLQAAASPRRVRLAAAA